MQRSVRFWTIVGSVAGVLVLLIGLLTVAFGGGRAWQSTKNDISALQKDDRTVGKGLADLHKDLVDVNTKLDQQNREMSQINKALADRSNKKTQPDANTNH